MLKDLAQELKEVESNKEEQPYLPYCQKLLTSKKGFVPSEIKYG